MSKRKQTVINCRHRAEAQKLLHELNKMGLTWCDSETLLSSRTRWSRYKADTCYGLHNGGLEFGGLPYYAKNGYTIVHYDNRKKAFEDWGLEATRPAPLSAHAAALKNLNLEDGDTVKVGFPVPNHGGGWKNTWVYRMDSCVGHEFKVIKSTTEDTEGVLLRTEGFKECKQNYKFPAFCLERVEAEPTPDYPKKFMEHSVSVDFDAGKIRVGCQTYTAKFARKILEELDILSSDERRYVGVANIYVDGHEVPLVACHKFMREMKPALEYIERDDNE